MGRQKASALILAGQRMTAAELESAGLVTKVLEGEGFLEQVLGIARGMVKLPEKSLKVNKALMMGQGLREDLLETNRKEMELLAKQAGGEESKAAIRGFKEETERKKKEKKESKL
jgi:peroxisomal 3,2-trans-enoyl-CoA isomerase